MALELREIFEPGKSPLPAKLTGATPAKRLDISQRDIGYCDVMATVLDVLAAGGWSVSFAARTLEVTTAHLAAFLRADHELWAAVARQRKKIGLRSLV